MNEYSHSFSIPCKSDSKGLYYNNNKMYFTSNNSIFILDTSTWEYSHLISLPKQLKNLVINKLIFTSTEDRIYMIGKRGNVIGTLKINSSIFNISPSSKYLAVGNNNVLEIWKIPREYNFTLFQLERRIVGHYDRITSINYINSDCVLTTSLDCTVRIFDLKKGKSVIIRKFRDPQISAYFDIDTLIFVGSRGKITFLREVTTIKFILDILEGKNIFEEEIVECGSEENFKNDVIMYGSEIEINKQTDAIKFKKVKREIFKNKFNEPEFVDFTVENYNLRNKENRKVGISETLCIGKDVLDCSYLNGSLYISGKTKEEYFLVQIDDEFLEKKLETEYFEIYKLENFICLKGTSDLYFTGIKEFKLDFPDICSLDIYRNYVIVGSSDNKVRLYTNFKQLGQLEVSGCFGVHAAEKVIISVSLNGKVDALDYKLFKFRSFDLETKISKSAINEDGSILFLAEYETFNILVVDIKRSKIIETLSVHQGPITCMKFSNNFLFSLSLDNLLVQWNVFQGTYNSLEILGASNFCINNRLIAVSKHNEIQILDLQMNILKSIDFKENIEDISFSIDNSLILVRTNEFLRILHYKTHVCIQSIKLVIPDNTIPILLHYFDKKSFVLALNDIKIYEIKSFEINPIELEIDTTFENLQKYLNDKNYFSSLSISLKMNNFELIQNILKTIPQKEVENIVKLLPRNLVIILRKNIKKIVKTDPFICLEWLKNCVVYHKGTCLEGSEVDILRVEIEKYLEDGYRNYYLDEFIKNKQ
ncbi:hypothetical protein CWI36_0112p0040 [Hamiltosporidium magnivora]|uniref:U3 small nucleolar RNA-associated protein n=1 Tax=Hamiltosporidium magnivora TaxID=148818 RepID=A0A4Q9LK68_9MICR|nr:hypothetical protein CWI36_0112p0040 [Hamiltosporidium magnivora]